MSDTSFEDDFNGLVQTEQTEQTEQAPAPVVADLDAEPLSAVDVPTPSVEEPKAGDVADSPPALEVPPSLDDLLPLAPQDRRDAYKALLDGIKADKQRLASEMGRQSALQRHYADARARAEEAGRRAQEAEERVRALEALQAKAASSEEDGTDDLEDYPEISKSVNMRIERALKTIAPPAARPAPPQERPQQQTNDAIDVTVLANQFTALAAVHPDWQQTVNSPEHAAWFKLQPPGIQALYESDDARDAIKAMNLYKAEVAQAQNRAAADRNVENRKRLENNVGIRSTPSRMASVPEDFEGAFNYFAKQAR